MKRNAMRKNLQQSIIKSFGRYIAIVMIIALGAGLFVGLLMTKTDMVQTGQVFTDEQNMFDFRLISNYGWTQEYVDRVAQIEGVADAEGVIYLDIIARIGETEDDSVYRFYSIPERINRVALRGGRMPQAPNECLADGFFANDSMLGQTVTISMSNDEDTLDAVRYKTFTIVGYVATPLYMDMNRGTTSVGSGSLANYFYVPAEAFDLEYYTEINITIPGEYDIYSSDYENTLDRTAEEIEPQVQKLAEDRFQEVRQEAEAEYDKGYREYLDGVKEFEEGKEEAERELANAYQELLDAEKKLADSKRQLIDGGNQIRAGRAQIAYGRKEIKQKKEELAQARVTAKQQLDAAKQELDNAYAQAKPAYDAAMEAIGLAERGVSAAESAVETLYGESVQTISARIVTLQGQATENQAAQEQARAELIAEQNKENPSIERINELLQTIARLQLEGGRIAAELATENGKLTGYDTAVATLDATKQGFKPVLDGMAQIQAGYRQWENEKAAVEKQLNDAEAQIAAAENQLYQADHELDAAYDQLMIGWAQLHEGEKELEEGWAEYEKAKKEAEQEIADAEAELEEARIELADAREKLDSMDGAEYYILDRTTNIGFASLDSSSDIVAGVSRVLPVFFLLVASLVCITTMTRMIDEERTQIGTLKALGYSNGEIISKYMLYSGSGAVLGCGVGVLMGSVIFPQILWQAYCIMLYIQPNVILVFDWGLCLIVVSVYTALMLSVTWYCCRKTLEEEPAELIRPKAPEVGKKILMEYLPFWHKISFLNKVTIRNIFRYRQRLAMMLVGIGGCTALLLTGFGLRDSIVNVVDYQFMNVTLYDMEVYFRDSATVEDKVEFLYVVEDAAENVMFYHQSSIELECNNHVSEIYLISGDDQLSEFIHMYSGKDPVSMPGINEVLLSVGVAEALDAKVGDTVLMRNADMQILEVTVSGIYDNHVYNYAIVRPETIEQQWGETPEQQMAFVRVKDGHDVHALGAEISSLDCIMNVAVSEDLAKMVGSMMDALDLVVMVIVFCAGLLAVIVLYNLTNININERIREIATIKVLGFNAAETAAYVFKENMTLTVVGSVFGLPLGYLLLVFVMSQIKINMVWFKALLEPRSFIWSTVLTFLSAIVVNFIFYFKLEKINMAEALKSVE